VLFEIPHLFNPRLLLFKTCYLSSWSVRPWRDSCLQWVKSTML